MLQKVVKKEAIEERGKKFFKKILLKSPQFWCERGGYNTEEKIIF